MLVVPPRSELRARPLGTARLQLHPVETTDARELFAEVEASRHHLERWLPWVPYTTSLEASHRYAEASSLEWDQGRACRFTIRERATKKFVGMVGLEAMVPLHASAELGYWLSATSTGRGYMTEASRELLDWTYGALRANRVRVAAATDNHDSLAVIARLGFRFEGIARQAERCHGRWLDHAVFGMLSTDPRPSL